jgi:quercetin dioxygenase-like cupin family protein
MITLFAIKRTFLPLGVALSLILPLQADSEKSPYTGNVQVKTLLRTSTNSVGQAIEYPHDHKAEVSVLTVEIAPGGETGWHKHPVPIFAYVLAGEVTVHLANGGKHTFHQGEAMAESVDMLHNGVNEGKEPTKLLVFVAGEKNVPFTVKEKTPGK